MYEQQERSRRFAFILVITIFLPQRNRKNADGMV